MQIDGTQWVTSYHRKTFTQTQDEEESMLKGHTHVVKTFFTHIPIYFLKVYFTIP